MIDDTLSASDTTADQAEGVGEIENSKPKDFALIEQTNEALSASFNEFDTSAQIDGRDAQVPVSGFQDSGQLTNQDVQELIENNVPSSHLRNLDSITYLDDPRVVADGVLGVWHKTDDTNYIHVYEHADKEDMEWTVAHELGHNAEDSVVATNSALVEEWSALHSSTDEFITTYAEASTADVSVGTSEDFAECYAAYIVDPSLLQALDSAKYNFMENNVFRGGGNATVDNDK